MKLLPEQTDEASLLRFGQEAVSLLERRDFQSLADRFDYAVKYDRSPAAAIEADFDFCLAEFHASSEQSAAVPRSVVVKYFKQPNSFNFIAVIECVFTAAEGCAIRADLIVTSSGEDKHITLETVSGGEI